MPQRQLWTLRVNVKNHKTLNLLLLSLTRKYPPAGAHFTRYAKQ